MKLPTGGIAHEPQGMIRCNSEADSIVWMKEDNTCSHYVSILALKWFFISELFNVIGNCVDSSNFHDKSRKANTRAARFVLHLAIVRNNFRTALISPGSSFLYHASFVLKLLAEGKRPAFGIKRSIMKGVWIWMTNSICKWL